MTHLLNHDLGRWYYFKGGDYRPPSKFRIVWIAMFVVSAVMFAVRVVIGDEIDIMKIVVPAIIIVLAIGVILYSKVKEKLKVDLKRIISAKISSA